MTCVSSKRIFQTILYTGFVLVSGALSGAMPLPAHAASEPELYFYPAQGWNIQQSARACSISSRFNNGFVISFHGDEQWVEEINVDLQQDILETGKTYNVTFSIPGVQSNAFKASGQSKSTLGINLRKHKDFYKALRQSSVLDMNLDDNNFRFYLTGFSKSAGNFERCMAGAVIENPENKTAKMLTDRSEEESFTINESIAMEEQVKTQATTTAATLVEKPGSKTVTNKRKDLPSIDHTSTNDTRNSGILDTKVHDLLDKPSMQDHSEKGRKRLSQQLAEEMEKNPDLIEDEKFAAVPLKDTELEAQSGIEPLTPVKDKAPRKNIAQQPSTETLLEPVESVQEDETKIVTIPSEELTAPEPETITKSSPPIKIHKNVMKAEADFTRLEPAAPGPDTQELRKQMLNLQDMVEALKKENRALNDELESALKESEDERLSIASENWNLERATMKFNEAERQIKRLGRQLQQERAKHNAEKKELEAMLFDPQVTSQAQLARLANLEEQLIQAEKELEKYHARYGE